MSAISGTVSIKRKAPGRSVALPVEHGVWAFLFEPLAVGLMIAPSIAALWLSLFVFGIFLIRQPLKFLFADWQLGRRLPRTDLALRFVLFFGAIAIAGLLGSLFFAPPESFIPFVAVAPLIVYLIVKDAARQTRQLLPELIAIFVLASPVPSLALAAGWSSLAATSLWAIMLARSIPSVLYVRNRLRLEKGNEFSRFTPISAHLLALILVGGLAFYGLSPLLTVTMFGVLFGRALLGLSPYRKGRKAKQIGIGEVIYGSLTVLSILIGYYAGV